MRGKWLENIVLLIVKILFFVAVMGYFVLSFRLCALTHTLYVIKYSLYIELSSDKISDFVTDISVLS